MCSENILSIYVFGLIGDGWGGVSFYGNYVGNTCIWATPCKNVSSSIYRQQRPRSTQSEQGLLCPMPEPLYTIECINGEQRFG